MNLDDVKRELLPYKGQFEVVPGLFSYKCIRHKELKTSDDVSPCCPLALLCLKKTGQASNNVEDCCAKLGLSGAEAYLIVNAADSQNAIGRKELEEILL